MFSDRTEAGRKLSRALAQHRLEAPIVYGLPRGGVPVACEVAEALAAPLDVILVRKIGAPGQEELALGAVVDGRKPIVVWNEDVVRSLGVDAATLQDLSREQQRVIDRRAALYAGRRPSVSPAGRTAIVVDDGLATGATARAALRALRKARASKVILAAPVAPQDTIDALRGEADGIVVLETPAYFPGVGAFYVDFGQTSDEEVLACLDRQDAWAPRRPAADPTAPG
jgi:predicted phosphoribosyltransferase